MTPLSPRMRWRIAAIAGATLLVGFIAGFLVERARVSGSSRSSTAVVTPSASATLLPTPSSTDSGSQSASPSSTATPTPAQPSSSGATPAPTLPPTPPVSNARHLSSSSGNGSRTLAATVVPDGWALAYSYLCSPSSGSFQGTILDASAGNQTDAADPPFLSAGNTGQGVQSYSRGGNLAVKIDTSCQWRVDIYVPQ